MSGVAPKRIAVLGAGISGLSQAYYLSKILKNSQVKIFEATGDTSGVIQSKLTNGFDFEEGPRSIRNSNNVFEVLKICEEIKILDKIVPSENFENVFVYYDDKLRQIPRKATAGQLYKFLLDNPTILYKSLRFQKAQPFDPKSDCSMEDFVKRKLRFAGIELSGLSDFINSHFVNSFAKGVYRAEASDLSADLCIKKQHMRGYIHKYVDASEFKKPAFSDELQAFYEAKIKPSGSFNFTEGVQTFPRELGKYLLQNTKTSIELNAPIRSLSFTNPEKITVFTDKHKDGETFDYVISTINSPQLREVLNQSKGNNEKALDSLKTDLQSIKQLPMVSMNLGYNKNVIPQRLQSFGYLIPSIAKQNLIGVVFDSCSYPTLGPKDSSRISLMFGNNIPAGSSQETYIEAGISELRKQTGIAAKPDFVNVKFWEPSFSEYSVNHFDKANRLIDQAKTLHPNFQVIYFYSTFCFCFCC